LVVLDPGTVVVDHTSTSMTDKAVLGVHGCSVVIGWQTVALSHIVEFTDIDQPKPPSKRKRASSTTAARVCKRSRASVTLRPKGDAGIVALPRRLFPSMTAGKPAHRHIR